MAKPGADLLPMATSLAAGVLAGSYLYASIFLALSVITSRGLIIGLAMP